MRREAREAEEERARRQAVAEARKEKIRSLEATRIANLPKSQLEQEEEEEKQRRREILVAVRQESMDDVKKMNSILNYALTVAIRNRQVEEKKERAAAEAAAEKMAALEEEIALLEAEKRAQAKEEEHKQYLQTVRASIISQVDERLSAKRAQREAIRKEEADRKAAAAIELAKERERKEEALKKKTAELEEIMRLNEEQIAAKGARKAAEREAEARADREAAEALAKKEADAAEKERQRKLKEEQLFKVRGEVQKIYSDIGRKDELRAKRAFEASERVTREKELEKARKRAAMLADLQESRVRMQEEKERRMAELIGAEKEEFVAALRVQDEQLDRERAAAEARAKEAAEHLRAIKAQMDEKEARARREREREVALTHAAREEADRELERLRAVRDRKVQELLDLGVDPIFTVELQKYDAAVAQARKEMSNRPPPRSKAEGGAGAAKK